MEPIKKKKLDKSVLRVPTDVKAALNTGMQTYDLLQVMGNTINEQAANTNAAIDYIDKTVETLDTNENERIENEEKRVTNEEERVEEFARLKDENEQCFDRSKNATNDLYIAMNGTEESKEYTLAMTHYTLIKDEDTVLNTATADFVEEGTLTQSIYLNGKKAVSEGYVDNYQKVDIVAATSGATITLWRVLDVPENPSGDPQWHGIKKGQRLVQAFDTATSKLEVTIVREGVYVVEPSDGKPVSIKITEHGVKGLQDAVSVLRDEMDESKIDRAKIHDTLDGMKIEEIAPSSDLVKEEYAFFKDGLQAGKSIKVYKDQALKNVSLNDQTLTFTYTIYDEAIHTYSEKVLDIDLAKFIQELEVEDGLEVKNGKVYVKLANNAETRNYLHFVAEGDRMAISLDGIENFMKEIEYERQAEFERLEGVHKTSAPYDLESRWGIFDSNEAKRKTIFDATEQARQDATKIILAESARLTKVEVDMASLAQKTENDMSALSQKIEGDMDTLSNSTEAAINDLAQKTDEKISELESVVLGSVPVSFQAGELNNDGSLNPTYNYRATSEMLSPKKYDIKANDGYIIRNLFYYDADGNVIAHYGNVESYETNGKYYVRFSIKKIDEVQTETISLNQKILLSYIYAKEEGLSKKIESLEDITEKLAVDTDTYIGNVKFVQGYTLNGVYSKDTKRISTLYIDSLHRVTPVHVESAGLSDVHTVGYVKYDKDYNQVEYVSVRDTDLTLEKGFIYSVVFGKNSGADEMSLDESSKIKIGDTAALNKTCLNLESSIDSTSSKIDGEIKSFGLTHGTLYNDGSIAALNYRCVTALLDGEVNIKLKSGYGFVRVCYYNADGTLKSRTSLSNATEFTSSGEGTFRLEIKSLSEDTSKVLDIEYSKLIMSAKRNDSITERLEELEKGGQITASIKSFKPVTSFLLDQFAKLKTGDDIFVNIGFVGDSWTQGTENIISGVQTKYPSSAFNHGSNEFQGYVKPLANLLYDEYGFGGMGWIDFAFDGGNATKKMFGCADMYENWKYSTSGTITGLDGNNAADAPNCLGICCAHSVFSNGASLTLEFKAGMIDVFKVRYYKNASFKVSVNDGADVNVTANSTDGWQETSFGTTGVDVTKVVITSLANNTIIFGMDCYYGTKGVRIHKIGNRSISAYNYLAMNESQWKTGLQKLNLCWASVLLAINDVGIGEKSDETLQAITNNIERLASNINDAYAQSGNQMCDVSILGVEEIEAADRTSLPRLIPYLKAMSKNLGYGWTSTDQCIGTRKYECEAKGVFSDTIHLNKYGSYSYAKHIYNTLFMF